MLPHLRRGTGSRTPPLTALFTATSAVCVTGQALVDTGTHWSLFGQVVLIAAIQIGGLGVMTLMALVSMALGKRIGLRQRTLLAGERRIVSGRRHRSSGALLLMREQRSSKGCGAAAAERFGFVPMLGWAKGIWYSVFHSISAFCNAGFDLMGPIIGRVYRRWSPLSAIRLINLAVVIMLILLGGLGFFGLGRPVQKPPALEETAPAYPRGFDAGGGAGGCARSAVLLLYGKERFYGGAAAGHAHLGKRCFPRSRQERRALTPCRPENSVRQAVLLTLILMMTGGNSGSTAGGAKTTTLLLVLLTAASILKGEENVHIFGRRIENDLLRRACSIVVVYLTMGMLATLAICASSAGVHPSAGADRGVFRH
ncbi:MAG: potassium transporter TrkG [Christensenellales bacterium]